ncbi:tRNA pseudouridine synthase B [Coccomyxa sp. Obi]|nr:tRNA pseudouridine synthase B [Coccomyxa sp. Obi]
MALHTAASPAAAATTSAEVVETAVQGSPDEDTPEARGHPRPRQSEDGTSGPASTSEPEQPAKRRKPSVPPPTMVKKGSSFTADVWQNAAILVDKPQDWTSFDVCGKLRGALKIKKVGHAGTLDPMATGLLIICTGRGTKQIDDFVAMEKAYSGTLRLGQATPSYDAMSEIDEELPWDHITDEDLEAAKQAFLGDILQQPPMFSAIKIKGERLYKAARRGEVVERQSRPVTIHSFELRRDDENKQDVHFRVACSKGTYIRSLAHDLGRAVGSAAHLTALRRESIGTHSVADAWTVPDLVAAAQAAREA